MYILAASAVQYSGYKKGVAGHLTLEFVFVLYNTNKNTITIALRYSGHKKGVAGHLTSAQTEVYAHVKICASRDIFTQVIYIYSKGGWA